MSALDKCIDAALQYEDRIKKLKAEIERLRSVLEYIADVPMKHNAVMSMARKALENKDE